MGKTDKHLTRPEGGEPIDHADMPVTTEPVEGGVAIANMSVPFGHEARLVYRELSSDEKRGRGGANRRHTKDELASTARAFVRLERNALLEATDALLLPDRPIGGLEREELVDYRQQLRDLPNDWKKPRGWKAPKALPDDLAALHDRIVEALEDLAGA